MNSQAYLQTYKNVERQSAAESEDPHAMIGALFDELLRRMQTFSHNLDGDEAALTSRNDCYARSLAILHALQSCLDFEKGGEVADNLFRLYEFARQKSGIPSIFYTDLTCHLSNNNFDMLIIDCYTL